MYSLPDTCWSPPDPGQAMSPTSALRENHLSPSAFWNLALSSSPAPAVHTPTVSPQKLSKYMSTRIKNSHDIIKQDVYLATISHPDAVSMDVTDLFTFWKPKQRAGHKPSSILQMTQKQHDAVYALAGCADVVYNISNISQQVRQALLAVYGIDQDNLSTWFKNRGRTPSSDNRSKRKSEPGLKLAWEHGITQQQLLLALKGVKEQEQLPVDARQLLKRHTMCGDPGTGSSGSRIASMRSHALAAEAALAAASLPGVLHPRSAQQQQQQQQHRPGDMLKQMFMQADSSSMGPSPKRQSLCGTRSSSGRSDGGSSHWQQAADAAFAAISQPELTQQQQAGLTLKKLMLQAADVKSELRCKNMPTGPTMGGGDALTWDQSEVGGLASNAHGVFRDETDALQLLLPQAPPLRVDRGRPKHPSPKAQSPKLRSMRSRFSGHSMSGGPFDSGWDGSAAAAPASSPLGHRVWCQEQDAQDSVPNSSRALSEQQAQQSNLWNDLQEQMSQLQTTTPVIRSQRPHNPHSSPLFNMPVSPTRSTPVTQAHCSATILTGQNSSFQYQFCCSGSSPGCAPSLNPQACGYMAHTNGSPGHVMTGTAPPMPHRRATFGAVTKALAEMSQAAQFGAAANQPLHNPMEPTFHQVTGREQLPGSRNNQGYSCSQPLPQPGRCTVPVPNQAQETVTDSSQSTTFQQQLYDAGVNIGDGSYEPAEQRQAGEHAAPCRCGAALDGICICGLIEAKSAYSADLTKVFQVGQDGAAVGLDLPPLPFMAGCDAVNAHMLATFDSMDLDMTSLLLDTPH